MEGFVNQNLAVYLWKEEGMGYIYVVRVISHSEKSHRPFGCFSDTFENFSSINFQMLYFSVIFSRMLYSWENKNGKEKVGKGRHWQMRRVCCKYNLVRISVFRRPAEFSVTGFLWLTGGMKYLYHHHYLTHQPK